MTANVNSNKMGGRWRDEIFKNLFSAKWLSYSVNQGVDEANQLQLLEDELEVMYGRKANSSIFFKIGPFRPYLLFFFAVG